MSRVSPIGKKAEETFMAEVKKKGFFGFQVHSGKLCDVRWRNVFLKEL